LNIRFFSGATTDWIKLGALAVSVLLFASVGIEVDRVAFSRVLRFDAEAIALAWQENLLENASELAAIAQGASVSVEAKKLLWQAVNGGSVFRVRFWDLQQRQSYFIERSPGLDHPQTLIDQCGAPGAQHILAGQPCTHLKNAMLATDPRYFACVFLPVRTQGKVAGVMEVYVDLNRHRETLGRAFLACEVVAGVTVLLAGVIPVFLVYRKMQAHRAAQERAEYLAGHDSLTGVLTRARLREQALAALALSRRNQSSVAVLMLDLDHFKNINDDYGHAAGDELLKKFAQRIRSAIREEDMVARLGGDEFIVLQVGVSQPAGVQALTERLLEALKDPYEISGIKITCASSIGVAMAPTDAQEWDALLSCADAALYRAKAAGRATACYFQKGMEEKLRERRRIELDLKKAIEQHLFHLVYQPIVHTKDGSIAGFEALLRWPEGWPERKPSEFIAVAEECGLMPELGAWVLHTACVEAASWSRPVRIAVNLSAVQFRQGDIASIVQNALKLSGLAAGRLELEITESLWIENTDAVLDQLTRLKKLGVSIVLDDFGTGYSSLKYLWKFPFDQVKIDRSFVEESEHDHKAAAIVETIAALGRTLHLSISAEGVETREQAQRISDLGCDAAQGYLYSHPLKAEQAALLVRKGDAA
jgi:diguanylate cyclase (GGDEF)-like protein